MPLKRVLRFGGQSIALSDRAQLVLARTWASHPDVQRWPYEVLVVDGAAPRVVVLRSSLANVLNDLRLVLCHWRPTIKSELQSNVALESLATKKVVSTLDLDAHSLQLDSPILESQFEITIILSAVAGLATIVVIALVAGQIRGGGVLTPLGLTLGALLIGLPATIAIQIALGRVRLRLERHWVHIERRHGIWRNSVTQIPKHELLGSWLIRTRGPDRCDLLWLRDDLFTSVPVACSEFENWMSHLDSLPT